MKYILFISVVNSTVQCRMKYAQKQVLYYIMKISSIFNVIATCDNNKECYFLCTIYFS